jgi:hypothetical protein
MTRTAAGSGARRGVAQKSPKRTESGGWFSGCGGRLPGQTPANAGIQLVNWLAKGLSAWELRAERQRPSLELPILAGKLLVQAGN